jgi:hypothetical protein
MNEHMGEYECEYLKNHFPSTLTGFMYIKTLFLPLALFPKELASGRNM